MKKILLNAFCMNSVAHVHQGLWRHPRDRSLDYADLNYWIEFAKLLEGGLFDGVFMADGLGVYDVFEGNADAALESAVMIPKNDPSLLVSAMAAVTRHLGFGITFNVFDEMPYAFARKMATLDHLTRGRMGWNVVTGFLDSSAKARGDGELLRHDERYAFADEFMDVMYQLWERSWEEGAVKRDVGRGVYADPAKIHRIRHEGKHLKLDAIQMTEPTPQRTPVLFQAGTSPRGIEFAAKHAECVYLSGATPARVGAKVKKLREACVANGRPADALRIFASMDVIAAATDAEARDKHAEYRRYIDRRGSLVRFAGFTGIDFSQVDLNEPIRQISSNGIQSFLDNLVAGNAEGVAVADAADTLRMNGGNPVLVGSGSSVADQLQQWVEESDVDGFNLGCPIKMESIADFIAHAVPALQDRGIYKTAYAEGTLREKLFSKGARLSGGHPAALARG